MAKSCFEFQQEFGKLFLNLLYLVDTVHGDELITKPNLLKKVMAKISDVETLMGKELADSDLRQVQKNKLIQKQIKQIDQFKKFLSTNYLFLGPDKPEYLLKTKLNHIGLIDTFDFKTAEAYKNIGHINRKTALPIMVALEDMSSFFEIKLRSLKLCDRFVHFNPLEYYEIEYMKQNKANEAFVKFYTDTDFRRVFYKDVMQTNIINKQYIQSVLGAVDQYNETISKFSMHEKFSTKDFRELAQINNNSFLNSFSHKTQISSIVDKITHGVENTDLMSIVLDGEPEKYTIYSNKFHDNYYHILGQAEEFINGKTDMDLNQRKAVFKYLSSEHIPEDVKNKMRLDFETKSMPLKSALFHSYTRFQKTLKMVGSIIKPDIIDYVCLAVSVGLYIAKQYGFFQSEAPTVAKYVKELKKLEMNQFFLSQRNDLNSAPRDYALQKTNIAISEAKKNIFIYEHYGTSTEIANRAIETIASSYNEYQSLSIPEPQNSPPLMTYEEWSGVSKQERMDELQKKIITATMDLKQYYLASLNYNSIEQGLPFMKQHYVKLKRQGMSKNDIAKSSLKYFNINS